MDQNQIQLQLDASDATLLNLCCTSIGQTWFCLTQVRN